MAKARPNVVKAQIARFPFLDVNAKDANPDLKSAIQQADRAIEGFDFNKLTPDKQAQFIEDAHKMTLAANVIDGYAANLTKEYQDYRKDVEAKLQDRDKKIADLEKRLTNKDSTTLAPGRSGQVVNGQQVSAKASNPIQVLQQGIDAARRSG